MRYLLRRDDALLHDQRLIGTFIVVTVVEVTHLAFEFYLSSAWGQAFSWFAVSSCQRSGPSCSRPSGLEAPTRSVLRANPPEGLRIGCCGGCPPRAPSQGSARRKGEPRGPGRRSSVCFMPCRLGVPAQR